MESHDTSFASIAGPGSRQAIRLAPGSGYFGTRAPVGGRFVQQSHALSAPIASPRSLLIAATVAIALYLLGRRLSE